MEHKNRPETGDGRPDGPENSCLLQSACCQLPPVTREDIVREARGWIGTPWRHQGRLKGVASDCVGLIIGVPRALGLVAPEFDVNGYPRNPNPSEMIRHLKAHMDPVTSAALAGDVLLLRPGRLPQHLAILTGDNTMIHAIDERRGVREHVLDDLWRRAVSAVYRYRGVVG